MTFWRPWTTFGVCWGVLVPLGLHWSRQGAQIAYLALPCRREHRFRQICWILGPECWQPVASCGGLWRRSRSPIEEDKMTGSFDLSILAPRSWIPAAWMPGGLDPSISAAWPPWLAGLMSSAGPCFKGWDLEGAGCSRLGSVV